MVEAILTIALLGALAFITLLLYLDVPPKKALYGIMSKFVEPPEGLRPMERYAPYKRMKQTTGKLHRPVLLNLETSDGSGQACHPDVVHIAEGFGSKRWPYWMACTPYPYSDDYFENPEIFVSYDGITWAVPDGARNPLVAPLKVVGDHHSDPDMLFHSGQLWLFYRETVHKEGKRENNIYLMKTVDGTHWSDPVQVLSDKNGSELLSPAVIYDGSSFVMWSIEIEEGVFKVLRRQSENGVNWSLPIVGSILGLEEGRHLWHIDVIQENDRLSAAIVSCVGINGGGSRIHYAYSLDDGLTWFLDGFLLEQTYEFESKIQYRGSLRKLDADSPAYELWYSAASTKNVFSIAYLRFVREGNRLIPTDEPVNEQSLSAVRQ